MIHYLRYLCLSKLHETIISLKEIQGYLGYSVISVKLNIYTHLSYKSKLNAPSKIEDDFL
jgi:site-specific recombinase XerD